MQRKKSSILSAILSLVIPGAGQVYNGALGRGVAVFCGVLTVGLLVYWKQSPLLYAGALGAWAWNVWDAYGLARDRKGPVWLPALLIALTVYVIGWQVTEIDLLSLATGAKDIRPLVLDLLRPAVFERSTETQVGQVIFEIPCSGNPPAKSGPLEGRPYLVITSDATCGTPGEQLVMEGAGFWPNSAGQMWWEDAIGMEFRVRQGGEYIRFQTDAQGRIAPLTILATEPLPEAKGKGPQPYKLQARLERPVGTPHLSKTFYQVTGKILETVFLALMATTLAILFAVPISFLAAHNLMSINAVTVGVYYLTRTILNILRSIEPLIMAIIFVVWVGLGPFAGVLALAVHSMAALAKLYSEAVESIDTRPIEAITATGANRIQTIVYAVIPQVVPQFVAFTIERWDINVRMSTIIGFVGGGGIGFLLQQWIRLLMYREAGMAVWAITIVVAVMDLASAKVREAIV